MQFLNLSYVGYLSKRRLIPLVSLAKARKGIRRGEWNREDQKVPTVLYSLLGWEDCLPLSVILVLGSIEKCQRSKIELVVIVVDTHETLPSGLHLK